MEATTRVTTAELYAKAHEAGMEAGLAHRPTPMAVTQVDLDGNPIGETHVVMGGVCGFAWVNIKPARGAFVNYLKAAGIGRADSYYGGYTIWVSQFDQSMEQKEAYASAFAKVLNQYGICAYSMSRMD